jgi:hypothetical protein
VRTLNLILMLLGALSVLMLGAVPASARTGAATPCHEAVATSPSHHEIPAPAGKPGKAITAMACCVSCVVTPALQQPARQLTAHPEAPATGVPTSLPVGLSPAPEHGPPKA